MEHYILLILKMDLYLLLIFLSVWVRQLVVVSFLHKVHPEYWTQTILCLSLYSPDYRHYTAIPGSRWFLYHSFMQNIHNVRTWTWYDFLKSAFIFVLWPSTYSMTSSISWDLERCPLTHWKIHTMTQRHAELLQRDGQPTNQPNQASASSTHSSRKPCPWPSSWDQDGPVHQEGRTHSIYCEQSPVTMPMEKWPSSPSICSCQLD